MSDQPTMIGMRMHIHVIMFATCQKFSSEMSNVMPMMILSNSTTCLPVPIRRNLFMSVFIFDRMIFVGMVLTVIFRIVIFIIYAMMIVLQCFVGWKDIRKFFHAFELVPVIRFWRRCVLTVREKIPLSVSVVKIYVQMLMPTLSNQQKKLTKRVQYCLNNFCVMSLPEA